MSLDALSKKEVHCDVAISDVIAKEEVNRRLFFAFNHPTNRLLAIVADRLCAMASLCFELDAAVLPEPLARIIPPSLVDGDPPVSAGHDLIIEHGRPPASGLRCSCHL